jgi:AraC-like DNA-binding protein
MNFLTETAALVIGIAAMLTFYTALLHLTRRKKIGSLTFRIGRDLIAGVQTLQLYFITKNIHLERPYLLYPFITLLFISGSLYYIRYYMFFYPGGKIPVHMKVQLFPAAVVLAFETWFYFGRFEESQSIIRMIFENPTHHPVYLVILAGVLFLLVQYALLLRLELSFLSSAEIREPVLLSSLMTGIYMLDILLVAGGFILANRPLMEAGILLMGLSGITYLLFENRYPSFYQLIAREERQKKYKKSLIQGVRKDKVIIRLEELMDDEKVYRQLELKLDDVASMLLLTPHQLSELLNDCLGMNFSTFVNRYRVEEAKELLVSCPDQSILSIAFGVGFGSKPSFNTIFKQQTGMTPSEFRKKV